MIKETLDAITAVKNGEVEVFDNEEDFFKALDDENEVKKLDKK